MNDTSKPRWVFDGGIFAASCEFDQTKNSFDFLLDDGRHKVKSFPDAKPEEIERLIIDIQRCCPLARKGESDAP